MPSHAPHANQIGNRFIKVNHAGEHGAVNIYAGQIIGARLTAKSVVKELQEFQSHEKRHRALFEAELLRREVPRCKSYWLCGLGGFVLGLMTGLLGRKAIAATTVAVEHVVLRHLAQQIADLSGKDEAAVDVIRQIVDEEQKHHDQSALHLDDRNIWSRILGPLVSASTESVIWIGLRA